jgi:hypothetical protein
MIMKFLGEVRVGLLQLSRSGPVWLIPGYWLDRLENWRDRLQERRDQREPHRSVSRFKVVRYAKAVAHSLGLVGWLWAALAVAGLFWLTKGAGFTNYLVTIGTALGALKAGAIWTRRNVVMNIVWDEDCPNCDGEER